MVVISDGFIGVSAMITFFFFFPLGTIIIKIRIIAVKMALLFPAFTPE